MDSYPSYLPKAKSDSAESTILPSPPAPFFSMYIGRDMFICVYVHYELMLDADQWF